MRQRILTAFGRMASALRPAVGSAFYGRGLASFEAATPRGWPTLVERIEALLTTGGRERVRLLELGSGEGRLLLDVWARFGDRVALHGVNHARFGGFRRPSLARVNAAHDIVPTSWLADVTRSGRPVIHLGDAQALERFGRASWDLVVSQVTLAHVPDKARALEQSARLLAPGGAFVHQIDRREREPGMREFVTDDYPRWRILSHDGASALSPREVLESQGVGVAEADRLIVATYTRTAQDAHDLAFGLRFDASASVDLKRAPESAVADLPASARWGWRSVYRV